MDFESIFQFLQNGNTERVTGIVIAFLIFSTGAFIAAYYVIDLFFDFIKTVFSSFKRREKIVEVTKYIEPPINKEMDKYLIILKKIADEYNSVKL